MIGEKHEIRLYNGVDGGPSHVKKHVRDKIKKVSAKAIANTPACAAHMPPMPLNPKITAERFLHPCVLHCIVIELRSCETDRAQAIHFSWYCVDHELSVFVSC